MRPFGDLGRLLGRARLTPSRERLLADLDERAPQSLSARQRRSELLVGGLFVLAATVLALVAGDPREVPLPVALALVVLLAVVALVEIQLGSGYAVPTMLVVVPLLFLIPLGAVAPLVALAMMLSRAIDAARGRIHPERMWLGVCDAWFVIGPVTVFAIGGVHGFAWSDWPWWLAALVAQFGVDTTASGASEWLRSGRRPKLHLHELGVVWLVDTALAPIGLLVAFVAVDHPAALLLPMPLVALVAALAQERRVRLRQALELSGAYQGVALLLGEVIEDDDGYTGEHSRGVVWLALSIADELGLHEHERRLVEFGALLHDVGKISVPNEIINKPGPLSDDEWTVMRRHTIHGQKMLDQVGGMMAEVGVIVRASHERVDGRGYPDGLAGGEIPIAARIVCCADAFSAMTTDRSYRKRMSLDDAIAELAANAGTQFDDEVVDATIRVARSGDRAPQPETQLLKLAAVIAAA